MSDRFDFEQQIIKCWNITDDIKEVSEYFMNYHDSNFTKDRVANTLNGLAEMYDIKFNKLWDLFEDVVMKLVRDEKMAREDADALREQLIAETQGYGAGKQPTNQGAGASVDFGQFGKLDTKYGQLETQGTSGIATMKANKKGKK